jgi:hypothetical protein
MDELIRVLTEELGIQRQLLDLGKQKRDALVAVDTARVDALTRRETVLLLAAGATAERRLKLTMETGKSSLSEIADVRVQDLAKDLKQILRELGHVTRSCRVLAEESLGFVRRFFRLVSGAGQERLGYGPRGAAPAAPPRLMIDEVV